MRKTTKKQEPKHTSKPSTTSQSEMLRVGLQFAEWVRVEAQKEGLTLAQFTDTIPGIIQSTLDEWEVADMYDKV